MRKTVTTAVLLIFFFVFQSAAFAEYKSEYKLSINTNQNSANGKGAAYFADLVKERTGGKVNITIFWSGQLFSGRATNELFLMKKNVGDFSVSSFINWAPQFPAGNLFLLPWFITSYPDKYKAIDALENGKAGKAIERIVEDRFNLKILAWGESGARELTNNVRPITAPEDMKGLKIRVVGSPLFIDIFTALGGNPMNISIAETITALQQGTVDGQENPYSVIYARKIYEFQKYMTEWSYNMDPLVFVVNKTVWESFPKDIQETISACATEAAAYEKALSRLGLDDGSSAEFLRSKSLFPEAEEALTDPRAFLRAKGVEITELTPDQIKAFRLKTQAVYEKWVPKIGKELFEAAEEDMNAVK